MPGAIAFAPGPPAAIASLVFCLARLFRALIVGPAGVRATARRLRAACAYALLPSDNGRQEAASIRRPVNQFPPSRTAPLSLRRLPS